MDHPSIRDVREAARRGELAAAREGLSALARANVSEAFDELSAFDPETLELALVAAAEHGAEAVVERLLVRRPASGVALRAAARGGSAEVVRRLIEAGAAADERDEWGRHALALAIAEGHDEIVTSLIACGAGLDTSAIAAAILRGDEALVLTLVDAGAPLTEHARGFAGERGMAKVAARPATVAAKAPARHLVELPIRERLRVLALLAHLAWVDDELEPREAALVRELATRAALLPDERARVEEWLESPPPTELIGAARALAPEGRALFGELARTLVDADGRRTEDETQTLELLGLLMG